MAGKGDKPRPVNKKQYNQNYEAINWKTKLIEPKETKKIKTKTRFTY